MEYKREIIVHGDYFAEFYDKQVSSVRQKINYVLNLLRIEEYNPQNHPDEFLKRNGSVFSEGLKRSGSILSKNE